MLDRFDWHAPGAERGEVFMFGEEVAGFSP
jgi:hypothetical protein